MQGCGERGTYKTLKKTIAKDGIYENSLALAA